jgi:hypothetical protein
MDTNFAIFVSLAFENKIILHAVVYFKALPNRPNDLYLEIVNSEEKFYFYKNMYFS